MANNTGFISKLGAETQLVDGTDAIHTGIIKTLNVAMGQNRLISTAVITQGTTSSYTHYEIEKTDGGDNALTAIRDGMVVSVPNKTITTNNPAIAANALGDKDWYGLIVIADGTESGETLNNLYFREGAVTGKANTSTATVAELKSGDIPIALIKYTAGSANNATNRDVQWLTGNVQTSRGFSAINGGSETFKINPTGTISYGSATITLPSSTGTLARTADITSSIAAISTGNNGLVPSAGNAGEFLKHDGTFGTPSYIANTNTQNVFTSSFVDSTDDILLRLTKSGASSGTQDIKFVAGSNVTLTHTDANNITIASTDTNTQLSLIDSDTMTGASATNVASAESVKAYVDNQVSGLVSSAPTALDTLNELAAALGDDANFATTTSTALGNRLRIDTASQNLTSTQKSNAITNLGLGAAATLGTAAIADGGTALATADQIHTFVTGQGYTTDSQISTEAVQDIVGAMFNGNTETRVGATYDDTSGKIDIVVDDMTADTNKFLSGLSLSGTTITATVTGGTNQTLDIASVNTDTNIGTTDIISGLTALSSIDIANDSLIFRDNSDSGAVKKLSLTELMAAVTETILPDLSAAKIISGEFATGRIPTLAQSKITDLTTDLAAKVPTSRTIAGKALSNNLTLAVNAAGKLEINDGGTAVIIQNASNADVIFDNSKITTATLNLDNVANESPSALKTTMQLDNVDNKSASTLQSEILTAATASDVGLGSAASDITTNATNIATNVTNIATNTSGIATNVTNIATNATNIATNVTAVALNTAKNTYPLADSTKVGYLTVTSALNLNTMATNIATNNSKISYTDASAVSTNTSKLTANATNVTAALVASTSINNDDKATILSNIGAGTSSFGGAFSNLTSTPTTLAGYGITDALAGNTTVNDVSVANLLARADDLTTAQATTFRTSIGAGSSVDSNDFINAASFASGTLTLTSNNNTISDVTVDISGVNTDTVYALTNDLAASEITAIQNIGTTTISEAQWGYLGAATGAITNTDSNVSKANLSTVLGSYTGDDTLNIGDAGNDTTINIKGNLNVLGTTTTLNKTEIDVQDALVFSYDTDSGDEKTTLRITEPTANRTVTIPDADFTIPTQDTTYSAATTSAAGLMSTAHFDILNSVTTIGEKIVATTTPSNDSSGFLRLAAASDGALSTSLDTNTYLTSVATANITDNAVTFAKLQDIGSSGANSLILGRNIADVGGASAISAPMLGVITAANQSAALSAIGADASGTDNSTDVTLVTSSYDYLSISGQEITLEQIDASADISGLATVATSGSYADLINIPTTFAPTLGNTPTTALAGDTAVLLDSDFTSSGFMKTNGSGTYSIDSNTYITSQRAISDTPTDGATTTAISSAWAYDNVRAVVPANAVFTDTNDDVSVANLKDRLNDGFGGTVQIGDANDTITIAGNLTVTGDTIYHDETIQVVEDNTLAFRAGDGNAHEVLLTADNPTSSDVTITLPVSAGNFTIPTQDTTYTAGSGLSLSAGNEFTPNLAASDIPNLNANKINDGTLDIDRIPSITTAKIAADAVTFAKLQNIGSSGDNNLLLGRNAADSGVISAINVPMISLVTAANASAARIALGATTVGSNLLTMSNIPTGVGTEDMFIRINNHSNQAETLNASDFRSAIGASASGTSNFGVGDITGATELTSGLADTDELILNDADGNSGSPALKRMDISVLKSHVLSGIEAGADVTDATNVAAAGALMDSELTAIAHVKALDQSVVSGAEPTFTTTYFTSATDKNLITDAQLSSIGDIAANTAKQPTDDPAFTGKLKVTGTSNTDGLLVYDNVNTDDYLRITSDTSSSVHRSYISNETGSSGTFGSMEISGGDRVLIGSAGLGANKGTYFWQGYEGGLAPYLRLTTPLSSGTAGTSDAIIMPAMDGKEIIFQQYDGTEVARIKDNATFDIPDSKLAIGGTAVTVSATELNLLDGLTSISSAQITTEQVQDIVGAMFATNTETGISATYADGGVGAGKINLAVGTAPTATALETARTISGVSFDGSENIILVSNNEDNTNFPVVFADESTGALHDDTGALRYNPFTGTLLVPNLNVAGTTTQVNTVTMEAANAIVFEGATSDDYETTLTITDPTADRTITLPNADAFLIGRDTTDTLTNKTINASNNTLSNIANSALTNSSITINGSAVSLGGSVNTPDTVYSLPIATSSTLGGIKVGSNLTISSGVLSGTPDTVYTHPTHNGDDIDIDTTALTGAFVISDLDLNITTDTLGHVTDANATIATRELQLSDLGFTGDVDATDDLTAAEIRTLVGTGNGGVLPSAGTSGHFLKHDGTFGALPSLMAFSVRDGSDTDVLIGDARFIKFNEGNGLDITFTDTDSGDTNDPFDLTFSVADNSIGADQLNVSGNGTSGNALLSDGDGSFSWGTAGGASAIGELSDAITTATSNIGLGSGALDSLTASSGNYNVALGINAGTAITTGDYNTAIGYQSLQTVTTGGTNTGIGAFAGNQTTGGDGTFIGESAGRNLTSGYFNTAIGSESMYGASSGATGNYNTAVGSRTLTAITTGAYNVAMGYNAGNDITTGQYNVGLGAKALEKINGETGIVAVGGYALQNADGGSGTLTTVGYKAGQDVTTAQQLVFVGNEAGANVTTGSFNTLVGNYSGRKITTGTQNTGLGTNALASQSASNMTGSNNVAVGTEALPDLTSGSANVSVGKNSSRQLTTGSYNIAIGMSALTNTTAVDYSIAIGQSTLASSSLTGAGNIAIGRYSGNDITTGTYNVIMGYEAGDVITQGAKNITIGYQAGDNITTGSNNVVIGAADVSSATGSDQLSISSGDGGTTWIQGNSDGIVLGGLTPLFYERAALDTTAVDFRVPTVQSSTANPNGYPMPFAGTVRAASFLFAGSTISTSGNTNTIRIRKNGGTSGSDIKDFTFTESDLVNTNGFQYTLVKSGSDVLFTFAAGDVLQIKRQGGSTDLNNSQAMLWVSYNF